MYSRPGFLKDSLLTTADIVLCDLASAETGVDYSYYTLKEISELIRREPENYHLLKSQKHV